MLRPIYMQATWRCEHAVASGARMHSGIDADIVIKVHSLPDGAEVCEGTVGLFTGCAACIQ